MTRRSTTAFNHAAVAVTLASFLTACRSEPALADIHIPIGDAIFTLEIASDPDTQARGLGGRDSLAPRTGMIFVFPEDRDEAFIMRDCSIPLDLLFLNREGRILVIHAMLPEAPRSSAERRDDPDQDAKYNARLRLYPSGSPCRFAIELASGQARAHALRVGDLLRIDADALLRRVHPDPINK